MFNDIFYVFCIVLVIGAGALLRAGIRQIRREQAQRAYEAALVVEFNEPVEFYEPVETAVDTPPRSFLPTIPGTIFAAYSDGTYSFREEGEPEPDTSTRLSRMNHIGILEYERMRHRAENPHLYADDWFEASRRELSAWKVERDLDARKYQKRAGITVRGIAA